MSQELLNSIIAKVAVHLPLLAKGIVENGLRKIGASRHRVTPRELKKALDDYIIPTIQRAADAVQPYNLLGGGFIYTDKHDRVKSFSRGVYQYVTKKLPIDHEDFFKHLYELGLVKKVEDFDPKVKRHMLERVMIARPQKSILEIIYMLQMDDSGEITGTISAIRDITLTEYLVEEVSELYEELQHSYEQLKEKALLEEELRHARKMEAIGQMAAGIAHDFNNMIRVVAGFADLILVKHAAESAELKNYLQIIKDRSMRAATLTSKLLAFARKSSAQAILVDVHDIIRDALEIMQPALEGRIVLKRDLNARQSMVQGDYAQLQNVILNLALNAKDAMPQGGELSVVTENVTLDGRFMKSYDFAVSPGVYIVVSVTDTGVGMTEEIRAKIFEPFYTTKALGEGTGLGLSTVYGALRSHHGGIEVDSEPAKGTTFKVYLPVAQESRP